MGRELNSGAAACAKHLRQEVIFQEPGEKRPLWLEPRVVRDDSRKEVRAKFGRTVLATMTVYVSVILKA